MNHIKILIIVILLLFSFSLSVYNQPCHSKTLKIEEVKDNVTGEICFENGCSTVNLGTKSFIKSVTARDYEHSSRNTAIIKVDNEGDGDFLSIQNAVDSADTDDTIYVYSGRYSENVIIDKKIDLIGLPHEFGEGDDSGKPIVDGRNMGDVITVYSESCLIKGLKVINSGLIYKSGIKIKSNGVKLLDNTIKNNHVGVLIPSYNNCLLINNTLGYNGFGFQLINPVGHIIKDNELYNTGLTLIGNSTQINKNILDNNTVNGKPIYVFTDLNDIKISGLDAGQIIICNCHNLIIENMNISDTTIGIIIGFSSDLVIRNNSFSNIHRGGISLHASNCEIYNNSFRNCSFSVYLENGCKNIKIHHNNFINVFQHDMPVFSYLVKRQSFVGVKNVEYNRNYWDEWIGLRFPFMQWFPKLIPGYINMAHKSLHLPPIFLLDKNPALKPY